MIPSTARIRNEWFFGCLLPKHLSHLAKVRGRGVSASWCGRGWAKGLAEHHPALHPDFKAILQEE